MAIRGQHLEIATEIFLDRFRLCGRFHNYQLHEKPLVLTVPYVRTREGGVFRVIVNRKFLVTSKRAVRYSRAGTPTQDGRQRYLSPRPSLLQAAIRNQIPPTNPEKDRTQCREREWQD